MRYLVLLSIVALPVVWSSFGNATQTSELPGVSLSHAELCGVWARGCGQFGSTTGNADCFAAAPACAKVPAAGGLQGGEDCAPAALGANCGNCTGAKNITCQGAVNPASTTLCSTYIGPCCPAVTICTQVNGLWHSCDCNAGAGAIMGMRSLAAIVYNSPACPGAPPGQ